jgi:hypothetical protein
MVHRVFLAPDGVTYLVFAFTFRSWPGQAPRHWPGQLSTIICQTFNSTGHRFETLNFKGDAKRIDPTARCLFLPRHIDPLDLYRAHVAAVVEWAKETGAELRAHEPLEQYTERQNEIDRQERKAYRANPYGQWDHWRWYLQLDAKPPAESK